jgi:hypothetical protein
VLYGGGVRSCGEPEVDERNSLSTRRFTSNPSCYQLMCDNISGHTTITMDVVKLAYDSFGVKLKTMISWNRLKGQLILRDVGALCRRSNVKQTIPFVKQGSSLL